MRSLTTFALASLLTLSQSGGANHEAGSGGGSESRATPPRDSKGRPPLPLSEPPPRDSKGRPPLPLNVPIGETAPVHAAMASDVPLSPIPLRACDGQVANVALNYDSNTKTYNVTATINYQCDGPTSQTQSCSAFSFDVLVQNVGNSTVQPFKETVPLKQLNRGSSDKYTYTSDSFTITSGGSYLVTVTLNHGTQAVAIGSTAQSVGGYSTACQCYGSISSLSAAVSGGQVTYNGTFNIGCYGSAGGPTCNITMTYVGQAVASPPPTPVYNQSRGQIVNCGNGNPTVYNWNSQPKTAPASGAYQLIGTISCGGTVVGQNSTIFNVP